MKVTIVGYQCIVEREESDPKRFNTESTLLHHIKKQLIKQGFDLIKKLMWKDGHLVDSDQHYLRARKENKDDPLKDVMIYNNHWAIRGNEEDYNKEGKCTFTVMPIV